MKTLNIVGCGRVGQTLGRLFHLHRACEIQDVSGVDVAEASRATAFISAGRPVCAIERMRPADIWMVTVPDMRIADVASVIAAAFARAGTLSNAPVAFHCSGALSASTLRPLSELGWKVASAHPIMTFASPEAAVSQFRGSPCGLEGDEATLAQLVPLFEAIGGRCFAVGSERKGLYHAAAVFCSNFTVVLQQIAWEAWAASGVPAEMIPAIRQSLLAATVQNVLTHGAKAITGPAARGDTHVVDFQIDLVSRWHPEAGALYKELSLLARRLAEDQSTLPLGLADR